MKRISDTEYITTIKGYIFTVLKTATGIHYFLPLRRQGFGKHQRKMIEELVLNNRDLYVGTYPKRIKKKISLYIKRYENNRIYNNNHRSINRIINN